MKHPFGVTTLNANGGTDFYVVYAEDHDEAIGIMAEALDKNEDAFQVDPLDIVLANQFGEYAMLTQGAEL